MKRFLPVIAIAVIVVAGVTRFSAASAAPSAEIAKHCIHYAYIAHPFKRPGAVRMSGERQVYIKDCMAKNGDVPAPTPPKP